MDTPEEREFGRTGWILVGGIVLAFLVIPAVILWQPPTGVSFRFAYLILPAIPAVALGIIAVWAALQAH